jgi:hypothetical protein
MLSVTRVDDELKPYCVTCAKRLGLKPQRLVEGGTIGRRDE